MKNKLLIFTIICIFFISCDSNNSSTGSNNSNPENQTIITSEIHQGNYYFDLLNGTPTDSSSNWQLSFQNKPAVYECTEDDVQNEASCDSIGQILTGFVMPSILLGNVLASVYDLDYDNLDTYPNTFMQDAPLFDNTSVEYGGLNEMISYCCPNTDQHIISLSQSVLIIYSQSPYHKVYKIKLNEYSSGIISFNFQPL